MSTTLGALRQAITNNSTFQISRDRYVDRRLGSPESFNPESKDDDPRIHRPHLVKAREYEHEREVRIVTSCPHWEKGALVRDIRWDGMIKEIIISGFKSGFMPYREKADLLAEVSAELAAIQAPSNGKAAVTPGMPAAAPAPAAKTKPSSP